MQFRVWLSRTVFESMLIVISILGALAVQDWQVSREVDQLIERSLLSFEYEITQNKARIEDLYPFHLGLQGLLLELEVESHSGSADEFRNILNSFQSAVLLTSAWDTALATGALAQMDYELVFALSLTYSIQDRFRTLYNSGLVELLSSNFEDEALLGMTFAASRYVSDVTAAEGELLGYYQQALELLRPQIDVPGAGEERVSELRSDLELSR